MEPIRSSFQHTFTGLLLLLACVLLLGPVHAVFASSPAAQLEAPQAYAGRLYPRSFSTGELHPQPLHPTVLHLADLSPARLHVADLQAARRH